MIINWISENWRSKEAELILFNFKLLCHIINMKIGAGKPGFNND